jgi:high-affinity iron transporter
MLPSFVLSLREGLEAALIIGIVYGALRKINRADLLPSVWWGFASAIMVSLLAAVLLNLVGAELEGPAEQLFEGFAMLLAAGILTWMIFWMSRHSRGIQAELEVNVRQAAFKTGQGAIFALAFLAVAREGLELALFLVAAGFGANATQVLSGSLLGLLGAAGLGWLLFTSTRRLSLKHFFTITNMLLILFAAGLVAHGVREFISLGWIPAMIQPVWDINPLLNEDSTVGVLLGALLGYNGDPSLTEVIAYLTFFAMLVLSQLSFRRSPVSMPGTSKIPG